jgi:large subunit ribosomal protein L15
MMLNQITTEAGAHHRRKRVGRGESSGHGKTCTHGNKGCQSRAGGGVRPLTEGGQMPLFRRLPKRGFSNYNFRTQYAVVNVAALEAAFGAGDAVDVAALVRAALIVSDALPVKILGAGTLGKKLSVNAHAFSAKAKAAIEQAGGTATVIPQRDPAALAKAKRRTAKKAKTDQAPAGKPAQ